MNKTTKSTNEIRCIYPNSKLPPLSKKDIEAIKAFKKIVLNYLKIKRIQNASTR